MNQRMKKRNWLLAAALLAIMAEVQGAQKAKHVILFLADAGGLPTVNAASIFGYGEPQKLFIQRWKHIGLSDTSSASQWVTDSAAGMTAIVTGRKSPPPCSHSSIIPTAICTIRCLPGSAA